MDQATNNLWRSEENSSEKVLENRKHCLIIWRRHWVTIIIIRLTSKVLFIVSPQDILSFDPYSCSKSCFEKMRKIIIFGIISNKAYGANECKLGTHTCSSRQDCLNTVNGFLCICKNGYELGGIDCQDIDECSTNEYTCPTKFLFYSE